GPRRGGSGPEYLGGVSHRRQLDLHERRLQESGWLEGPRTAATAGRSAAPVARRRADRRLRGRAARRLAARAAGFVEADRTAPILVGAGVHSRCTAAAAESSDTHGDPHGARQL